MAVRASIGHFPLDPEFAEQCGIPWGVAVTPFSATDERGNPPALGTEGHLVPRCENCWAYFNPFCELDQWSWSCALCGCSNGLTSDAISRYSRPESCAELSSSFVDLEIPGDGSERETTRPRPVYVAAVDLNSSEEFLELVKSALLAALEALPPGSLFGLVTFSHKIGLYDIQGPIAVVKNVFIPPESDGQLPISLEDVMPLLSFLAPVDSYKDQITAALDTLRPTTYWENSTLREEGLDGVWLGGRGFGAAMEAVISYLTSDHGNTYALARVFAFLSGPPDYGPGEIDTTRYGEQYASKGMDADLALLTEQTPFYKDLAALAVQAGVSVDIYAVTNEYTDLASLKLLCINSGGSLFLYVNIDDSTLPQDIYRMLSRPYAFGCLLRLRTSSEFKTGYSYGHFFPDPQYENVQHIICCDSFATYTYDFEFTNTSGFSRHMDPLIIQIAFQYSVVVPNDCDADQDSGARSRYFLKRRLRVRTVQLTLARSMNDLYDSVDPDVVLTILVHKILIVSLEQGVKEGRLLLHDWLTILLSQYNDTYKTIQHNGSSNIDVAFSQCPQLQSLPRLVFALLRSPLLRCHEEGVHPDHRVYLQCLFSSLEPSSLQCATYPVLSSYETPDKQAYPRHSLSRAALITSGSPIYFLDAFTHLIVYYSSTADASLPFPPPHDCLLRATINRLKKERTITPKLTFIRGGHDDATAFDNYLIEDKAIDGSGLAGVMGFVSFLEELLRDVAEYMK